MGFMGRGPSMAIGAAVGVLIGMPALTPALMPALAPAWAESAVSAAMEHTRDARRPGYENPFESQPYNTGKSPRVQRRTLSFFIAAGHGGREDWRLLRDIVDDFGDPRKVYIRIVPIRVEDVRIQSAFFRRFEAAARKLGVPSARIEQVDTGDPAGVVINTMPPHRANVFLVAVDRYASRPPRECKGGRAPLEIGHGGLRDVPGFGCASAANLAAQIAEPRDLEQGRRSSPGRAERLGSAYQRYRQRGGNTTVRSVQQGAGD